ncbi:MAG: hypothetical protein V5804_16590 [Mucilaginibacter sp.]|uniref:hypothetical protein n=1 Tax=Mucilaginibacter sp. TaxID=1882438 RepID=UPI0034E464FE
MNTSFYYWKTSYQLNQNELQALNLFHSKKLYIRMMDVDLDENGALPVPISPVVFKEKLPDTLALVPVVFVVNRALQNLSKPQLDKLSAQILYFVNGKVKQAGKNSFDELQIDCDWTASTRDNYFYLLHQIKALLQPKHQQLSVTLRLHQLKNQKSSGIPPANRVLLMCYNMGNLRKYGRQNSILELAELKKYLNENLKNYPLPADVALPLFSWAVAFRNKQYIGISKRLTETTLQNQANFTRLNPDFYVVKTALPNYGLQPGDEIRWENIPPEKLQEVSRYLSGYLKPEPLNLIFFHLDAPLFKKYSDEELEKTADLLR